MILLFEWLKTKATCLNELDNKFIWIFIITEHQANNLVRFVGLFSIKKMHKNRNNREQWGV